MKKKGRPWLCLFVAGAVILCLIVLSVFSYVMSQRGYSVSVGRFYQLNDTVYLVDDEDMATILYDSTESKKLLEKYNNGDRLLIVHGGVETSYPALTDCHFALRLRLGDGSYKPEDSILGMAQVIETEERNIEFTAEYARTGGYVEGNAYPIVHIISSFEALDSYYEENYSVYSFNRSDKSYTDTATGFIDAYDNYGEKFFEDKALIFVILEEPSGSIRHNVEYVTKASDGVLNIGIEPIVPEACTDDMAIWHIIIAVDKNEIPENGDGIVIFYNGEEMTREIFDFSITWNTYGISSYDSKSATLIKTKDATSPEDYITTCYLSREQMKNIRNIIEELDITNYPDEYNPHGRGVSIPYMTLELSVVTESFSKTVTVPETVLSFETEDAKGQRFLNAFAAITDILTNTDEWKALPDYEFYYD